MDHLFKSWSTLKERWVGKMLLFQTLILSLSEVQIRVLEQDWTLKDTFFGNQFYSLKPWKLLLFIIKCYK